MTREYGPDPIVIVGGGAGGLELACKLGNALRHEPVILVDQAALHVWKPSLHELAAGTLDIRKAAIPYESLAHDHRFSFVHGTLAGLDADKHEIILAPGEKQGG